MTGLNHKQITFEQISTLDSSLNFDSLPAAEKIRYTICKIKFYQADIIKYQVEFFDCFKKLISIIKNISDNNRDHRCKLILSLKQYLVSDLSDKITNESINIYLPIIKLLQEEFHQLELNDFDLSLIDSLFSNNKHKHKHKKQSPISYITDKSLSLTCNLILICILNITNKTHTHYDLNSLTNNYVQYLTNNQKINILHNILDTIFLSKCKNLFLVHALHQANHIQFFELFKIIHSLFEPFIKDQSTLFLLINLFADNKKIKIEDISTITITITITTIKDTLLIINNFYNNTHSKECENFLINVLCSLLKKKLPLATLSVIIDTLSNKLISEISKKQDLNTIIKNSFKNDCSINIVNDIILKFNSFDKDLADLIKYSKWFTDPSNCNKEKSKEKPKEKYNEKYNENYKDETIKLDLNESDTTVSGQLSLF